MKFRIFVLFCLSAEQANLRRPKLNDYAKQTQFPPFLGQKQRFGEKTNPNKPNLCTMYQTKINSLRYLLSDIALQIRHFTYCVLNSSGVFNSRKKFKVFELTTKWRCKMTVRGGWGNRQEAAAINHCQQTKRLSVRIIFPTSDAAYEIFQATGRRYSWLPAPASCWSICLAEPNHTSEIRIKIAPAPKSIFRRRGSLHRVSQPGIPPLADSGNRWFESSVRAFRAASSCSGVTFG